MKKYITLIAVFIFAVAVMAFQMSANALSVNQAENLSPKYDSVQIAAGAQTANDILNNMSFYYLLIGALLVIAVVYIFAAKNKK